MNRKPKLDFFGRLFVGFSNVGFSVRKINRDRKPTRFFSVGLFPLSSTPIKTSYLYGNPFIILEYMRHTVYFILDDIPGQW